MGTDCRQASATCFFRFLEGCRADSSPTSASRPKNFEKNRKNSKIPLGNWEKSGYNKME